MLWLRRLTLRLRSLVLPGRTARELDYELQFHMDREIAERSGRSRGPIKAIERA